VRSLKLIKPRRHGDERGWLSEVYSERTFAEFGIVDHFVQDNHSCSAAVGTVRGLHFQLLPHAQAKLVRCVRGAIWDVAVDLRQGSPTYGQYTSAELTAENGHQLYIPVGYAHGFVTLEPDTEIVYKVTSFYAPTHDAGIAWDDADIAIEWPMSPGGPVLSIRDTKWPPLRHFRSPFVYDGRPLVPVAV